MRKRVVIAAGFAIAMAGGSIARAQNQFNAPMMQYLGYTALYNQYGIYGLADGSNVNVAQVEGSGYLAPADGRFSDKTLIFTESSTVTGVSHATNCGAEFFGNETGFSMRSVAPRLGGTSFSGVVNGNTVYNVAHTSTPGSVQLYTANEFIGPWLLEPGSAEPYGSNNNAPRVASHTYTTLGTGASGTFNDYTLDLMARMDDLEQRDDDVQVVTNSTFGSFGDTFNSVVVVSTDGTTQKTDAIKNTDGSATVYTAGRVSPTVTGPWSGSPSDAIGQVAGVVGLLMSEGKLTHSNYSYTTATTNAVTAPNFSIYQKPGYTVESGDTSEVVKAALMAGALRSVQTAQYFNGATLVLQVNGITDYRVATANQSANGLDYRYGAGMVNAQNSYYIIAAGETDSAQDHGGTGGGIGQYGFDYDPHFGGANGSNKIAQYGFTAGASPGKFMASLVWNVKIAGASTPGGNFSDTPTLYNMSLTLTDTTTGSILAQSATLVDNTQNIWTDLTAGDNYMLTVNGVGTAFDWDYGLAWRSEGTITAMAVPEPAAISLIGLGAAGFLRRRRVVK